MTLKNHWEKWGTSPIKYFKVPCSGFESQCAVLDSVI